VGLLKRAATLAVACSALLPVWNCDPTSPPLHRVGVDTTWQSEAYSDSIRLGLFVQEDTLWRLISREPLSPSGNQPELDSFRVTWNILHFQIRERFLLRIHLELGEACTVDSGPVGTTQPPVKLDCSKVSRETGTETTGPFHDTIWIDTLPQTRIEKPNPGPILGQLVQGDTLRKALPYPQADVEGLTVYNPEHQPIALAQSGDTVSHRFADDYDTLFLSWPPPAESAGGNKIISLGRKAGIITLKNTVTDQSVDRPFSFSRPWTGFVPGGSALTGLWAVQGKNANLSHSEDGRFSFKTAPSPGDSLLRVRSLFAFQENFQVSVKVRRPIEAGEGCFVAMLFTDESEPYIEFRPKSVQAAARFEMTTTGFGLSYNAQGIAYPVNTYGPSGMTSTQSQKIAYYSELAVTRKEQQFSVTVRDLKENKTDTLSIPQRQGAVLPSALRLFLIVGNYSSAAYSVDWEDFTISAAKVELP